MHIILGSVAAAVVLFIALGLTRTGTGYRFKIQVRQLLCLLPLALIAINFVTVVPANSVGVQYSPFTGVKEETLAEGIQTKGLFDTVYMISTEVQSKELENITGQTKDAQYVDIRVDVKYRVDSSRAYEVFRQYKTLENVSNALIAPTVQRSIETISTQYNIIEILGEKRNELYEGVEQDLANRLAESGISFVSINFIDTDAGEAIETAIQNEAIAKKAVETAEQERQRVEIEAQQRVIEAQANQEKAQIEAQTQLIQAEAEAEANRIVAESITPELLDMMEMEARMQWGWVTVQGGSVITDVREQPRATQTPQE